MILWRISDFDTLTGIGGTLAPGRWHRRGPPILYTAESASLAMLEVLAGLETDIIPITYRLLQLEVPDTLAITDYDGPPPALRQSQDWGMAWLEAAATPLARVPSAIVPVDRNILINPGHPDARQGQHPRREPLPLGPALVPLGLPRHRLFAPRGHPLSSPFVLARRAPIAATRTRKQNP